MYKFVLLKEMSSYILLINVFAIFEVGFSTQKFPLLTKIRLHLKIVITMF